MNGCTVIMGAAPTIDGLLIAAGTGLVAVFPDKTGDPSPEWVMPVVIGCFVMAAVIALASTRIGTPARKD